MSRPCHLEHHALQKAAANRASRARDFLQRQSCILSRYRKRTVYDLCPRHISCNRTGTLLWWVNSSFAIGVCLLAFQICLVQVLADAVEPAHATQRRTSHHSPSKKAAEGVRVSSCAAQLNSAGSADCPSAGDATSKSDNHLVCMTDPKACCNCTLSIAYEYSQ